MRLSALVLLLTVAVDLMGAVSLEKDLSLTLKQKQALDKFRKQVKPLLKTDFMKSELYSIRWLRAANFDINTAEALLKENLRWREAKKMDTIMNENFKDMFRDYPATFDTHDRQGRPVGVIDILDWDIREVAISGKGPRLLRYLDMLMENVTMQVADKMLQGKNVTQWTVIANAETFNMITHGCPICLPIWVQFVSSLENHYQGWMNEFILIEAPQAAHTMFGILKQFLSPQSKEAIKIFGRDKKQWEPYMDARISKDQRRALYGGTKPPFNYDA